MVKRYIVSFVMISLLFVLVGCNSKDEQIAQLVQDADNYYKGNYFDEANKKYIEALNIKPSEEVNEKLINSYITEGDILCKKGDLVNAIARYDNAIKALTDESSAELKAKVTATYHILLARQYSDKKQIFDQIREQCEAEKIVAEYHNTNKEFPIIIDTDGYNYISKDEAVSVKNDYDFYDELMDFYTNDINLNADAPTQQNLEQAIAKTQNYLDRYEKIILEDAYSHLKLDAEGYNTAYQNWSEGSPELERIEYDPTESIIADLKLDIMNWENDRTRMEIPIEYHEIDTFYDSIMKLYGEIENIMPQGTTQGG